MELFDVIGLAVITVAGAVWGFFQERQHQELVRKHEAAKAELEKKIDEVAAEPSRRFEAVAELYERSNRRIEEHVTSRHKR